MHVAVMPYIKASVGIAHGKQCYNVPADQMVVQELLDRIPLSHGGRLGESGAWIAPRWGACAPDLHTAILSFQTLNRSSLPYGPDGHVDPWDPTILLMNRLAGTPGPTPEQPSGPTGGWSIDVDDFMRDLRLKRTDWRLTSSSGASLSARYFAGSRGTFYVENDKTGEKITLSYMAAGAASGKSASFSFSMEWMPSWGSPLFGFGTDSHDKRATRLAGAMLMLSGSAYPKFREVPVSAGLSFSYVFFNPPNAGMGVKAAVRDHDLRISNILREAALQSGAVGVIMGLSPGTPDFGLTLMSGWVAL